MIGHRGRLLHTAQQSRAEVASLTALCDFKLEVEGGDGIGPKVHGQAESRLDSHGGVH